MDHTDHFSFRVFLRHFRFQVNWTQISFCGGQFSDRVSSEGLLAVSDAGPPAFFFPEIEFSGFVRHARFWKKLLFQIHGHMNLFCGGKFSDRDSSEKLLAVSAAGPPAFFFPEIDISGFLDMPILEKSVFLLRFGQICCI